ncbi:hypothetical protein SK3146_03476 [Paenibacillus konkukensis]|uniref:DAC domain-containing protein n=1 Tax=Paenibacillus konkukensis TaxID=2020716 RepID=A0ABY4RQ54_9BACL|nr:hypothetical protein SK3146_03476 [Paenibacillus konkukensis]
MFGNLEDILKRLNKKFDLKLYTFTLDNNDYPNIENVVRVRRALSDQGGKKIVINQEPLKELIRVFRELDMSNPVHSENNEIRELMKDTMLKEIIQSKLMSLPADKTNEQNKTGIVDVEKPNQEQFKTNIIYANDFAINTEGLERKLKVMVVIHNVDSQLQDIFYNYPELSFIRMVLDYYFQDYFIRDKNVLKLDGESEVGKKYNEDAIQFSRRMTRLFMGKIQTLLQGLYTMKDVASPLLSNEESSQYYINILLEKIDDISTRTYEGSNPFGCMLFADQALLHPSRGIIKYIIRFRENEILLDDSKLIRKLLEMTDHDKDIYLISDEKYIYGIGHINWNEVGNHLLFRVVFKGLSKYNLQLLTTVHTESRFGKLFNENDKKIYKTERNLEIVFKNLLQVSFKSPVLGEEGFTTRKFKRMMKAQFFENREEENIREIDTLERVVRKAREQKHGTMVVITDEETAGQEVERLKKQSIIIEPTAVNPDVVQYLTPIDGAVYFDNTGVCHAVGVILDGIAEPNIGDSSRGARYNSAYRYLHKLDQTKCIIVIISEDGMVNLIPELDEEEPIRLLFQQFIDHINQQEQISNAEIEEFKSKLAAYKEIDYQHYFTVANAFYNKGKFADAIYFFREGLEGAGNYYITTKHYRGLANAYFFAAREGNKSLYHDALSYYNRYIIKENEDELDVHDFNNRGLVLEEIGDRESKKNERLNLYGKALLDFNKAISYLEHAVLYSNRAYVYKRMEKWTECLEDFIHAELLATNKEYLENISAILTNNPEVIGHSIITYLKLKETNSESGDELAKLLEQFKIKLSEENPEAAVALEEFHLIKDTR